MSIVIVLTGDVVIEIEDYFFFAFPHESLRPTVLLNTNESVVESFESTQKYPLRKN